MTRFETIDTLLDELYDLDPASSERERQGMGCTVPEADEEYGFAVADLREAIAQARKDRR